MLPEKLLREEEAVADLMEGEEVEFQKEGGSAVDSREKRRRS